LHPHLAKAAVATLVIRNVENELHARLKAQATAHRRSMEEEARVLLRQGLAAAPVDQPHRFVQAMRALFEPLGGLEVPAVTREPPREPPDLSGPDWDPPGDDSRDPPGDAAGD